jgi:hypothetical protein
MWIYATLDCLASCNDQSLGGNMALNKELLDILVCPECKGDLELTAQEDGLICRACAVVYPIREEIPIMLVEEAVDLKQWPEEGR